MNYLKSNFRKEFDQRRKEKVQDRMWQVVLLVIGLIMFFHIFGGMIGYLI